MMFFAANSSVPLVGLDADLALGGQRGRAHEDRHLVLFIRWPTPELSCLATPRERFTTASRS